MSKREEELKLEIRDLKAVNYIMESELASNRRIVQQVRQEAIDASLDLELYTDISEKLWKLLDDIDTASDILKPSESNGIESFKNFYAYVQKKHAERFEFLTNDPDDNNKLILNPVKYPEF